MKNNLFYKIEMDKGKLNIYLFKPSFEDTLYGKYGNDDNPSCISPFTIRNDLNRVVLADSTEPYLDDLKWFIMGLFR